MHFFAVSFVFPARNSIFWGRDERTRTKLAQNPRRGWLVKKQQHWDVLFWYMPFPGTLSTVQKICFWHILKDLLGRKSIKYTLQYQFCEDTFDFFLLWYYFTEKYNAILVWAWTFAVHTIVSRTFKSTTKSCTF